MTAPLNTDPPADPPTGTPAPPADPPTGDGGTDWEAKYKEAVGHSREWEKRAKDNSKAADELAKVKAAAMSDQEKAVAAARDEGRAAALADTGKRLAAAELRAILGAERAKELADVIAAFDMAQFLGEDGEPDSKRLTALAKSLGKSTGQAASGGEFTGAPGTTPTNLASQIAKAEASGDWKLARQLKSQLLTAPK